jgi:adenylate kinase family enzyme
MNRVLVVGAGGSGKSTIARYVGDLLRAPVTDLDSLFWEPAWRPATLNRFRSRVAAVTRPERWVVAGNYSTKAGDLLWERADTLVWLDLPRMLTFSRLLRRTLAQALRREELFPGCRQSLWAAWRDGLFHRGWRETARYRELYRRRLADTDTRHLRVTHLTSKHEVRQWLSEVGVRCA